MATHLDLEEQEQLDAVKQFWTRYGNLISGLLVAGLLAYAGWTGWNWWQQEQATQAGAMFDELDKAAEAADADKVAQVFGDLKARYPKTAFAQQGGLLAAKTQVAKGQTEAALATLEWVGANATEVEYRPLPGCAWPGCCWIKRNTTRPSSNWMPPRPQASRHWWPTGEVTCKWHRAKPMQPRRPTPRPGRPWIPKLTIGA